MDTNYHIVSGYQLSYNYTGVQLIDILAKQRRKMTILLNPSDSFVCPATMKRSLDAKLKSHILCIGIK